MTLSVIILSKTISDTIFDTTMNCIRSLQDSENFKNNNLEILLIESNADYSESYSYPKEVKVIIPAEEFGFHKFLNIGIKAAKNEFIALCNNDLIFNENWFSEIIKVAERRKDILSFSPIDPRNELGKFKGDFLEGYKVTQQIKGWCLVCKRELFNIYGLLDDKFKFYYSDNDYALSLLFYNIKHVVVTNSKVVHLHKVTTKDVSNNKDAFFEEISVDVKVPKYLYHKNLRWILSDKRVLFDHLTYYKKWGNPNSTYRISRYALKLNKLHLNIVTKALFLCKRIFKV
jgi:GT2 family glycosyltransferase